MKKIVFIAAITISVFAKYSFAQQSPKLKDQVEKPTHSAVELLYKETLKQQFSCGVSAKPIIELLQSPGIINQTTKMASTGNPYAQYVLGVAYNDGWAGLQTDYKQADFWFRKAAHNGVAAAQDEIGGDYMLKDGSGNASKAAFWIQKAASQGLEDAQFRLGQLYEDGTGVPQNYAKARNFYLKVAEQGDSRGFESLASLYKFGDGVQQSNVIAYALYKAAILSPCGNQLASHDLRILSQGMSISSIDSSSNLYSQFKAFGVSVAIESYLAAKTYDALDKIEHANKKNSE